MDERMDEERRGMDILVFFSHRVPISTERPVQLILDKN